MQITVRQVRMFGGHFYVWIVAGNMACLMPHAWEFRRSAESKANDILTRNLWVYPVHVYDKPHGELVTEHKWDKP